MPARIISTTLKAYQFERLIMYVMLRLVSFGPLSLAPVSNKNLYIKKLREKQACFLE